MWRTTTTLVATCGLVLGIAAAGMAAPRTVDLFVSLPEVDDEVLLVVTVGRAVPGDKSITVDPAVASTAYRAAWSSARDRRNRRREANALAVAVTEPGAFDAFGSVPLSHVVSEEDIWATDRIWTLYVPTAGGVVDRSALARLRMPAVARRVVRSLIDTSTGEIVWADEN